MTDLVATSDIEAALLRPLSATEQTYIPTLIAQASSQLRSRRRAIDARIAAWTLVPPPDNALDPFVVAAMLAAVIKRVLVNPKGLWSASETDGDYSISETYPGARAGGDAAASPGDLQITDADLAKIDVRNALPRSIQTCPPHHRRFTPDAYRCRQ